MQNTTDRAVGSLLDALKIIWRDNKEVFQRVEGQRLLNDASDLTAWTTDEVETVLEFMAGVDQQEVQLN